MSKANYSTKYTIGFAAAVCIVCSILVSTSAVTLRDRQEANKKLDRQKNVLVATGLIEPEGDLSRKQITDLYEEKIRPLVVDMKTGEVKEDIDPAQFDQRFAMKNEATSRRAPENPAKVQRVPNHGLVYQVMDGDGVKMIVLPVQGMGLWSTLYGYLALEADTTTIAGIAFYEHGETPGLGGEIESPGWQAKWIGRKAFDEDWEPRIRVIKGEAGEPDEDPYQVDGLTGATLTANGVTELVRFWISDEGYGRYLAKFREQERGS